jgi:hypothetical protein
MKGTMLSLLETYNQLRDLTDNILKLLSEKPIDALRRNDMFALDKYKNQGVDFKGCWNMAIKCNELNIIEWLHKNNIEGHRSKTMKLCIERDNVVIAKYLHENNIQTCGQAGLKLAIRKGSLAIINWIINDIGGMTYDNDMFTFAIQYGHVRVIEWACSIFPRYLDGSCIDVAATYDRLDIAKYLHSRGAINNYKAIEYAASNGNLDMVDWLNKNYTYNSSTVTNALCRAIDSGHLHIVKWFYENRPDVCSVHSNYMYARDKHIDIANWIINMASKNPRLWF